MLDSEALTKIQSVALIAIIALAALGGTAAYFLWNRETQAPEDIRIGLIADLDSYSKGTWQGSVLAAEQLNAQGGVLGRNLTVVAEDDYTGGDLDIALPLTP